MSLERVCPCISILLTFSMTTKVCFTLISLNLLPFYARKISCLKYLKNGQIIGIKRLHGILHGILCSERKSN